VDVTPQRLRALKGPDDFTVAVLGKGLENARIIAVAPDSTVYVSRRDQGSSGSR